MIFNKIYTIFKYNKAVPFPIPAWIPASGPEGMLERAHMPFGMRHKGENPARPIANTRDIFD